MTFQTPMSLVDSQSNHPHHSMSYYMNQHYCCKYIVFFRNIFFNSIRFINNTLLINLLPLHHPMNIIQSIFQELIKLPYKLQNQELFCVVQNIFMSQVTITTTNLFSIPDEFVNVKGSLLWLKLVYSLQNLSMVSCQSSYS